MTKISYTAELAHKDMNDCLALRAAEQKRKYEDGLAEILEKHFNSISRAIKDAATKGCSSITYTVYDWVYNGILYDTQTIASWVLEELVNAGYEADFTEKSDESDEWYEFYIHW